MIQEELRNFIEQNCSGVEPSDIIMEAIAQKIEMTGSDAEEVLAFVEECSKGPTLEQKIADAKRKVEAEAERLARIEEAKAKAESDARNAELAAEKARRAMAEAEEARQKAEEEKAKLEAHKIAKREAKNKKRTYIVAAIVTVLLLGIGTTVYLKVMTGKSVAEIASEAAYNSINDVSIDDIEVSTEDVPSDDPSVVIDPNGDVKAQLEQHYENVFSLNAGFYKLKDKGKYGLADKNGKIIQRPKYDEIHSKNKNGLISVLKDGKKGFLNLKGVEVLSPKYSDIEEPHDGLMKVKNNELYGFIDANTLKEVTPCVYTYIYEKKDGKYKAMKGNKEYFLDEKGSLEY